MKGTKLYPHRAEIERALRRLPYVWSAALADRVGPMFERDERLAGEAADRARAYAARVQEGIIRAIPYRLLHEPGGATATLDRIAVAGPEAYGLRRLPVIETVRLAVEEARRRNPRQAAPAFGSTGNGSCLSSTSTST